MLTNVDRTYATHVHVLQARTGLTDGAWQTP